MLSRANLPSIESILLQLQIAWEGHVSRIEDTHITKALLFGELSTGKRDHSAPKKHCKDQLKRELAMACVPHHSWQQTASSRDNWQATVRNATKAFERERSSAAKKRRIQRKERTSNQIITIPTQICPSVIESVLLALAYTPL